MAEKFVGTWKMVESDNIDEYLKALGVGFAMRQVASKAKQILTVAVDADGTITFKSQSIKTNEGQFKLNEEFESTTGDGRKTKNVVTLENGKLIQRQMWDGKETVIERELVNDKLIMKLKMGDVVATRTFEKQA